MVSSNRKARVPDELGRARASYGQRAWAEAYQAFCRADRKGRLAAEDLERLAVVAFLTGRDDAYLTTLERAYDSYLAGGEHLRAVRCAFWLGFRLLMRGEMGRASGWFGRGERLLAQAAPDCAERGYLLLPVVEQRLAADDYDAAYALAEEAARLGESCHDEDLVACARHQQGRIHLQQGEVESGLALLDETMLAVTTGDLSPVVTGLMYCSVIQACQQVYALDRTREWTAALTRWCEQQPDMVAFAGACRVHRAEILQVQGAWSEAVEEAQRARARAQGVDRRTAAAGLYQQAEVHRLRGEFAAAEAAYHAASELGLEPQPGLALLRLAQGRKPVAAATIRRVATTTAGRLKRLNLLPAFIDIMLATAAVKDAAKACDELEDIAKSLSIEVPDALAAQARGAVRLAEGDARAALGSLRRAFATWERIGAPHLAARARVLIGRACRALGDEDGAALETSSARATFERLGAAPDLAELDATAGDKMRDRARMLTAREIEVLRLVASGGTNRAIGEKLHLSERTIERHLSNIFTKLDLATRAAATAWAYEHDLV